jgi:hypothetical protein
VNVTVPDASFVSVALKLTVVSSAVGSVTVVVAVSLVSRLS